MSRCIHVAKCYDVQWGDTAAFNWKLDEFYKVLRMLGANPVDMIPNEWAGACEYFECDKDDFAKAMENLKKFIKDPEAADDLYEVESVQELTDAIAATGCAPKELLRYMRTFLMEADTRDGYLYFAFF